MQEVRINEGMIMNKIYIIREQKVMLDRDLAELYGTATKRLNEQVIRNIERFPDSFMFQLTEDETNNLRSQNATANISTKSRTQPRVFTEHGILMLSNVLKSDRAIKMSIHIINVFVKMREMILTNKDILLKLEKLEKKIDTHDMNIEQLYDLVKQLIKQESEPRTPIGFRTNTPE